VEENICQLYIRQGTDNQNIQALKKLNSPKISEPIKKWATELNRTFSKEEIQMAKKHMKKMLTISGHKGNANQNHTKIPLHPIRIAIIKNRMRGERNPFRTLLVGMQASATTLENNMEAS
jgi:hypothetical protein